MGSDIPQPIPAIIHSPKPPPKSTSQAPDSGHDPASVPSKSTNKAQNDPRSGEDHPLFDRKLLDILYEQGVRSISAKTRIPAIFRVQR